ncbi:MAG: hypothetical protein CMJ86_06100 [Planctomycetes bacterium]|nr:hypothetical protein [Planctomycetota bacterium]
MLIPPASRAVIHCLGVQLLVWLCLAPQAEAQAIVPGLAGAHVLSEAQVGELLIVELRCAACHEGISSIGATMPRAPRLDEASWRISPEYLKAFILDPAGSHPGAKMPDVLARFDPRVREDAAAAIPAYLSVLAKQQEAGPGSVFEREPVDAARVARGRTLFHAVGCVACHALSGNSPSVNAGGELPDSAGGAVGLEHVASKYSLASLSDFLFQPLRVRPAGRMPDMGLSRVEAEDVANYLLAEVSTTEDSGPVDLELAELGGALLQKLSCVSCHDLQGLSAPAPVTKGRNLDPNGGCLSEDSKETPRYQMSPAQRAALRAALGAKTEEVSDAARIDQTLTSFNCIACHVRGEQGGVAVELDPYFGTSEPELGDAARIPPPLTLAGAKLNLEWMQRVLFDGEKVRPFMDTRMPQFGEANLAHLPALFESVDHLDPLVPLGFDGDEERRAARDGARKLLGTTGLACVACHNFNGKETVGFKGIDLVTSHERLKFSWFKRFVVDPQEYRPGIVMPESWSGGIAAHTEILGGDTDKQISAIWDYLSLGRSARDPQGLSSVSQELVVGDRTRTYRGRSQIAGFRGIAVGYPGGLSYAFDANNGTLSGIWRGRFVSVRWDGQGAGGFNPSSRPMRLAQDLSFYKLEGSDDPWPLKPVMDDENPVNPDPQYPRNRGYRFRGYHLDQARTPTFMYSFGKLDVTDKCEPILEGERPVLRRSLSITAPEPETIWFRPLTGEVQALGPRAFKTGELELRLEREGKHRLPFGETLLRSFGEEDPQLELLIQLIIPRGTSKWRIEYELLR